MGKYVTNIIDNESLKEVVHLIRNGYTDLDGVPHKPNPQIATILILQANMGCRIGDIVNMRKEDIVFDSNAWKLNIIEEKTGKARPFIIPRPVKDIIDMYCKDNAINSGRLFTIKKHAVWKQMRAVTKYLGLENTSCHSLRKASAMRVYISSGKDIALTCDYLNHSSPKTTMRYLKRSSKQMDEAISKSVILL